jgi:hypothetical protein
VIILKEAVMANAGSQKATYEGMDISGVYVICVPLLHLHSTSEDPTQHANSQCVYSFLFSPTFFNFVTGYAYRTWAKTEKNQLTPEEDSEN